MKQTIYWALLFGNVLDHYDTALYGLLAPVFAPLFFPKLHSILALACTYLILSASLLSKPFGALFFGNYTLKLGPKRTLTFTLSGLACSTGCMGCIPSFEQIGYLAPLLITLSRLTQGFFAAGERSIGNLYLLELTPPHHQGKVNSAFNAAEIGGIFLASLAATASINQFSWRLPFFGGFATALIGLYLRNHLPYTPPSPPINLATALKNNRAPLIRLLFASAFTYLTYSITFVFFNAFIPLITDISMKEMLHTNSLFLLLDFLLLPLFGTLSDRFDRGKWLLTSTLLLALTAIPLFLLLSKASLWTVSLIRLWIVCLGLAYLAPFQTWFFTLFSKEECYLLSGFGYSLGAEIFGKTTPAISLFLWHQFNSPIAPALYVSFISLSASFALLKRRVAISALD